MAHEIFSRSTINTKRNLLAVSILAIIHAKGWVKISSLPLITGSISDDAPVSWIMLGILVYLSISTTLHAIKDLKNQASLPSTEDMKNKKHSTIETFRTQLSNYPLSYGNSAISFEYYLIENIFFQYSNLNNEQKDAFGNTKAFILGAFSKTVTRDDSYNGEDKNRIITAVTTNLDETLTQYVGKIKDPTNNLEDNIFYMFFKHAKYLGDINKTSKKSNSSNNNLKYFEIGLPAIAAISAFYYLCKNI